MDVYYGILRSRKKGKERGKKVCRIFFIKRVKIFLGVLFIRLRFLFYWLKLYYMVIFN